MNGFIPQTFEVLTSTPAPVAWGVSIETATPIDFPVTSFTYRLDQIMSIANLLGRNKNSVSKVMSVMMDDGPRYKINRHLSYAAAEPWLDMVQRISDLCCHKSASLFEPWDQRIHLAYANGQMGERP